ncbi:SseB family protein [Oceanibium sediminis]|uniref:SseB family protein n=1 Tax=Oceanibium sediminis TaxID=2026339 RepID=UPI000DD31875|nr:SseB family protein [Oceanibium sediminis]
MAAGDRENPALKLETPLDAAHDRMIRAGEGDEAARRAFFAAIAASELILLLEEEPAPGADSLSPLIVEPGGVPTVLAFDTDARAAAFLQGAGATATLSGQVLAQMVGPAGLSLALNLDVAPSAIILPGDALAWIAETATAASQLEAQVTGLRAPEGLPQELLDALEPALAASRGQAGFAALAEARYGDGTTGLVLGLPGVAGEAQAALSAAVASALSRAGFGALSVDVMFPEPASTLAERLRSVGILRDLPAAPASPGSAPGGDPNRPPRLI